MPHHPTENAHEHFGEFLHVPTNIMQVQGSEGSAVAGLPLSNTHPADTGRPIGCAKQFRTDIDLS
jgi:hypothetical protein